MSTILPGKFVFLYHPRTASCATKRALVAVGGKPGPVGKPAGHHGKLARSLIASTPDIPIICTIRNPYDVVASYAAYRWPNTKKGPAEFAETHSDRDFCRDGRLYYHAADATRFIRYECLYAELHQLLDEYKLPLGAFPFVGETESKKFRTRSLEDVVKDRFPDDVQFWRDFIGG